MTDPRLSVIIPATDSPPTLDRCLAAVRAAAGPGDELIVVTAPPGSGPAAARNLGAQRAENELLAFVDADVLPHPDALARIRQALAEGRAEAVFGCYDDAPEAPGRVSRFRNLLHHHVHAGSPGAAETFWAGLGGAQRASFERAGGFDAARFPRPSVEDVELGMRLRDAGARIELDPAIRGTHLKAWSLRSLLATDLLRRGIPWVALAVERGRMPATLNLGWQHRAGALAALALALSLALRRPRAAALALLAQLAIHRRLYALLARRGGPALLASGVALHSLHHLVSILSVPLGMLSGVRGRGPR